MERGKALGVVLALVGALFFSTKVIFVKLAYQYDIDTLSLLLLRMVFALPFYVFILNRLRRKEAFKQRKIVSFKSWLGLIAVAFSGYYLASLLDFSGLKYIDASIERLVLFIYPTFIAVISFFVFRERISPLQWGAIVISYLGLVFVFGDRINSFSTDSSFWWGVFLIITCALSFAASLVMSQWLLPIFGTLRFTSISMILACLFVIFHFLLLQPVEGIFTWPLPVYLYATGMAILATVLPSYLVNYSIAYLGATRSAILASIGPVFTISLAYWFLDERLDLGQIAGGLLVIAGVTVVSIELRKK